MHYRGNKKLFNRSSKGLNGGAIAAIIVAPIVAIIALVGAILCLGKRNVKVDTPVNHDSVVQSIQNLNNTLRKTL